MFFFEASDKLSFWCLASEFVTLIRKLISAQVFIILDLIRKDESIRSVLIH